MVGLLTYGKRQWEQLDSTMRTLIPPLYSIVDEILPLIEADTEAFDSYVVRSVVISFSSSSNFPAIQC